MERRAKENMEQLKDFDMEWGTKNTQKKEKKSKVEQMIQQQEKNRGQRMKNYHKKKKGKLTQGDQHLKLNTISDSGSSDEEAQPDYQSSSEQNIDFDNYESDSDGAKEEKESESD